MYQSSNNQVHSRDFQENEVRKPLPARNTSCSTRVSVCNVIVYMIAASTCPSNALSTAPTAVVPILASVADTVSRGCTHQQDDIDVN